MNKELEIRPNLQPKSMSIEDTLEEMRKYGTPNLLAMGSGSWFCYVEMVTNIEGGKFDINSDNNHKTIRDAVETCFERVQKAVKAKDKS